MVVVTREENKMWRPARRLLGQSSGMIIRISTSMMAGGIGREFRSRTYFTSPGLTRVKNVPEGLCKLQYL